ncbi:hypothetical protein C8Q75DRAFT_469552 [Abortiporus biennis]|nr:hypothetical protein C8Q75DRAFT_469552 [Abortiporus biennis]
MRYCRCQSSESTVNASSISDLQWLVIGLSQNIENLFLNSVEFLAPQRQFVIFPQKYTTSGPSLVELSAHLPALSSNFRLKSLVELNLPCYGLLEENEVSLDAHNFPSLKWLVLLLKNDHIPAVCSMLLRNIPPASLSRIRFNLDIFDDRRAPHHNCGLLVSKTLAHPSLSNLKELKIPSRHLVCFNYRKPQLKRIQFLAADGFGFNGHKKPRYS